MRIGLDHQRSFGIEYLELIESSRHHTGNEDFPHTGGAYSPHHVTTSIPVVEVAHNAHPLGVGRPYSEAGSGNAIDGLMMRSQLVIDIPCIALVE